MGKHQSDPDDLFIPIVAIFKVSTQTKFFPITA